MVRLASSTAVQGSFPGTLFRFPLRSDSTAATSNIKAQATTPGQALGLLQSLTDVLPQALLFLKSLQEVEVYVVGDTATAGHQLQQAGAPGAELDTAAADTPTLLFRANLKPLDGELELPRLMGCGLSVGQLGSTGLVGLPWQHFVGAPVSG